MRKSKEEIKIDIDRAKKILRGAGVSDFVTEYKRLLSAVEDCYDEI